MQIKCIVIVVSYVKNTTVEIYEVTANVFQMQMWTRTEFLSVLGQALMYDYAVDVNMERPWTLDQKMAIQHCSAMQCRVVLVHSCFSTAVYLTFTLRPI